MTTTLRVGDTVILDHDGTRQEYVVQKADVVLNEQHLYRVRETDKPILKQNFATLSLVSIGAPLEDEEYYIVDIHETQR